MSKPQFDLVVFGATSFVGQILCRYLLARHGSGGSLSWAMAGRSAAKLEKLRTELGDAAASIELIVADAADEAELRDLCAQARVVISTVGPYALFGSELVKVCAETGTDYCDLTGEVQWIRRMLDAHEATAKASGARIVHCCGFDSIPSDLGVMHHQAQALEQHGEVSQKLRMRAKMRGAASGGTVASMVNITKEVTRDPSLRKALANPYLLTGKSGPRQINVNAPEFDADSGGWATPFIMAGINTRVVHRSNALRNYAYGEDFLYDESMLTGKGAKGRVAAAAVWAGLGGFLVAAALPPTRWALERFVLPKPGEGPSPQEQLDGYFDLRFYGTTASGKKTVSKVTGDRDPGYGSTAKMLGEAAACLALDLDKTATGGGFWTPASLLGVPLMERLRQHAGLTFEVLEA